MIPKPLPSASPPTADDLIDGLRHFFRANGAVLGTNAIDAELTLFQFQKLMTLGQLAAEVAHDYGNLTTVLYGYSEMLLKTIGDKQPEREYCAEMHRAAERAAALTAQLLSYSRQSSDTPGPVNLAACVRHLKPMLLRILGSTIQLTIAVPEINRHVLADARLIEQVLVNLTLNARDALPSGGNVEVRVEPFRLTVPLRADLGYAAPGDYVRLSVTDGGCGMSPTTRSQLFRPFFTTKPRGTGLGLTIVARIAKQCRAAVTVQSEPSRGTTFALYFPVMAEGHA